MAKKIISDEVIVDSDEGLTSDSEDERQLEQKAVEFVAPRKYSKKIDTKFPKALQSIGKKKEQIWLIKLPKNVNIDDLKTLSVGSNEIFEINDKSYSIMEEEELSKTKKSSKFHILTPDSNKAGKFKTFNDGNVVKFLDIVETVKIPAINYDNVVIPRKDVEKETGLRMRHFPTGYYIKDFDEAKEPVIPGPTTKSHKRKLDDVDDVQEKKEKKHKKDKKDKKGKKEKKDKKEKKSKKN